MVTPECAVDTPYSPIMQCMKEMEEQIPFLKIMYHIMPC